MTLPRFVDEADRDRQIPNPRFGLLCLVDGRVMAYWDGAWVLLDDRRV